MYWARVWLVRNWWNTVSTSLLECLWKPFFRANQSINNTYVGTNSRTACKPPWALLKTCSCSNQTQREDVKQEKHPIQLYAVEKKLSWKMKQTFDIYIMWFSSYRNFYGINKIYLKTNFFFSRLNTICIHYLKTFNSLVLNSNYRVCLLGRKSLISIRRQDFK